MLSNNTIIGWINGKAIAITDKLKICYCEMPKEYTFDGEALTEFHPINELSKSEQEQIINFIMIED